MMDDRKRDRAKRLIRELQNRTTDRGCTEAEALEAADMIGKLLEENDLEMTEVGLKEEAAGAIKNMVFATDDFAGTLVTGIKLFCGLICYRDNTHEGHGATYVLFGLPQDVDLGMYLYEVCAEAMEHDWAEFMNRHGYSMKKRASFRMGFANRVYERLKLMKEERDVRTYRATGTALVVMKQQIVKAEFDRQLGIKLVKQAGKVAADRDAYHQGRAAGGRVNLNNPLGGGEDRDRIR